MTGTLKVNWFYQLLEYTTYILSHYKRNHINKVYVFLVKIYINISGSLKLSARIEKNLVINGRFHSWYLLTIFFKLYCSPGEISKQLVHELFFLFFQKSKACYFIYIISMEMIWIKYQSMFSRKCKKKYFSIACWIIYSLSPCRQIQQMTVDNFSYFS